jgi:hypothetical protein
LKKVKNPDKETVLTPEKVVDLHYSKANIDWTQCENKDFTIIDINSKSAIYPLYAVYKIYEYLKEKYSDDIQKYCPNNIIKKNIYVICRTEAARMITKKILGVSNLNENWVDQHIIQYDIYKEYEKKQTNNK